LTMAEVDRLARERYEREQQAVADKERERARKAAETHAALLARLDGLVRRALEEFPQTRAAEMTPYPVRRGKLLRRKDVLASWPVGTVDRDWASWPGRDMPMFLLSNGDLIWSRPGPQAEHAFGYRLQDQFGDADLQRMCENLEALVAVADAPEPTRT
jgi:hypothetical protein